MYIARLRNHNRSRHLTGQPARKTRPPKISPPPKHHTTLRIPKHQPSPSTTLTHSLTTLHISKLFNPPKMVLPPPPLILQTQKPKHPPIASQKTSPNSHNQNRPQPTTKKPSPSSTNAAPGASRSRPWATCCARAARTRRWRRLASWRSRSVGIVSSLISPIFPFPCSHMLAEMASLGER